MVQATKADGRFHGKEIRSVRRRDFIAGSLGSVGAWAFLPCTGAAAADGGHAYDVSILGDTHYDTEPESVYHAHYDESNVHATIQHAEFKRNGEMWRERCPRLLAASAKLAHANKTAFVLQLGDLIQGDCDHAPTHQKMLDDCIKMLRAPYPGDLPFLTVVGNHDFRGKGARKAYFDFAHPFMTAEIGKLTGRRLEKAVRYPVLSFRKGPDLWILCDFEKADLNHLCDVIEGDHSARHVFLVSHGPFTTPDGTGSYRWRLGGWPQARAARLRLFKTLSARRGIVLSGHTHTTVFYRFETEHGSFCEFTGNSVWTETTPTHATPDRATPQEYGPSEALLARLPKRDDYLAAIGFFKPALKAYYNSRAAGHYRLKVTASHVEMAFYPCDAVVPGRVFRLK